MRSSVFEQLSSPQPPLHLAACCHLKPIHISEFVEIGKPLLNFKSLLRLPQMHTKNENCFLAPNAISFPRTSATTPKQSKES